MIPRSRRTLYAADPVSYTHLDVYKRQALKEGLCVNCGSLLMLESRNEKGHCLFCDAVFDNKEAFRAKAEPDQFTFPNEPQPPYEGPNLSLIHI